ncbi:MAG: hypothetical protein P8R48_01320 [Planctomycetota bacterium]|nr:hypothetical protein [Planctomycetota bacterium]
MHFLKTIASFDLSAVDLAEAIGRLHPMLLHMPIGLIVALAILEFPHLFKKSAPVHDRPRTVLVTLLAITSMASATAGWLLHEGGGYGSPVEWHEWLGVGLAFLTVAIAISYWRKSETYTLGVLAAFILLIPTAHLGATLTHGDDFLTEPWEPAFAVKDDQPTEEVAEAKLVPQEETEQPLLKDEQVNPGEAADVTPAPLGDALVESTGSTFPVEEPGLTLTYADIAPILKSYCIKCHGTRKRKGDLALHDLGSIMAGGEHGEVLVPGDPLNSKLITTLSLPVDDDHHMPPEGKKQPSADAIAQLTLWVQGMDSAAFATATEQSAPVPAEPASTPEPSEEPAPEAPTLPTNTSFAPTAPNPDAIQALASRQVYVQALGEDSDLMGLNFTASSLGDETITSLLAPIAGLVGELCLYGKRPSDQDLLLLGSMPRLAHLDMRNTGGESMTLGSLRNSKSITSLNLAGTTLAAADWDALAEMKSLKRVHLWGTGISEDALQALSEQRPDLVILGLGIEGDAPIETEPEVDFTRFVPDAGSEEEALTEGEHTADAGPENATCPVSDKPVDPAFTVVHEGRTIGFCCANCPKSFLADPAKYLAILNKN